MGQKSNYICVALYAKCCMEDGGSTKPERNDRNENQLKWTSTSGCLCARGSRLSSSLLTLFIITFMTCSVCITSLCAWVRLIAEGNSKGKRRCTINQQCGVSLDHIPSQLFAGVILNNTNVSNWAMCFHLHEMAHYFRTHWSPLLVNHVAQPIMRSVNDGITFFPHD